MSKKFYGLMALGFTMLITLKSSDYFRLCDERLRSKFYNWMQIDFIVLGIFIMLVLSIFWLTWGILEDISKIKKAVVKFLENYEEKDF